MKATLLPVEVSLSEEDIQAIAQKVVDILKSLHDFNINGEDELLTIDEAAALLKRDKNTLYQMVNNSKYGLCKLPYLKQGRRLRFSKNALLKWSTENHRPGYGKKMVRRLSYSFEMIELLS